MSHSGILNHAAAYGRTQDSIEARVADKAGAAAAGWSLPCSSPKGAHLHTLDGPAS